MTPQTASAFIANLGSVFVRNGQKSFWCNGHNMIGGNFKVKAQGNSMEVDISLLPNALESVLEDLGIDYLGD